MEPIRIVAVNAITCKPTPAAIPIERAKNIKIISNVSFTAVLKRIIDIAPTSPNALAKLLPITIITTAVIMVNTTSELRNETVKPPPLYVPL